MNPLLQSRLKLLKTRNKAKNKFNNKQKKQIQIIDQQPQALRNSSEILTRPIQESSNIPNKYLQKSIKEGIQEFDEIINCNIQLVTDLVNLNQVDFSIVRIVSNLLNTQSQFRLCGR